VSEAVALRGAEGAPTTAEGAIVALPIVRRHAALSRSLRDALLLVCELAALWAINKAGYLLVSGLHAPLPGNVAGMLLLFALLCTGLVPARLFERSSTLLARHLAFFFVPIAVGLIDLGPAVVSQGWLLVLVLVASAAVGLCLTGWVAQLLSRAQGKP